MCTITKDVIYYLLILYLFCTISSATLIKSVTLTPQNAVEDGASVKVLKDTITTSDSWNMRATDEIGFFLLLSLNNTWGFDNDSISTINITINSDSVLVFDMDLLISFSVSDTQYITSWLNLDNQHKNNIYPSCDRSENPTETFVIGDVNALVSTDSGNQTLESDRSRKAMGKHEGRYFTTLSNPGSATSPQNQFPITFTLENYPNICCGDYLFWSITNPTIAPLKQSCGFKAIDTELITDQGLQIYISTEDNGERLNISSFTIDYYVEENCEELQEIKHINWNNLVEGDVDEIPKILYDIHVSSSDLSISINLTMDYLGYSYGTDDAFGYGTTYQLGFHSFDGLNGDNIYEPSNCDNRLETSFNNRSWNEYWIYSEYPFGTNQIGNDNFLSYPNASEHWVLSSDPNNTCSKIKYSALFKWDELLNCKSFDGTQNLVDIKSDDNYINISGIFYVNIISPISRDSDIGQYYVYELLSYPFIISVKKTIYVLDSSGIYLFTASIISVRKNNAENIFNMIILTESADYISLTNPVLLSSPNHNNHLFSVLNTNSSCTSINSLICIQFWELEAMDVSCPFIFTGEYVLQFDTACHSQQQLDKCTQYIQDQGSIVSLSVNLIFDDTICDDIIWSISYDANIVFYADIFSTAIHGLRLGWC